MASSTLAVELPAQKTLNTATPKAPISYTVLYTPPANVSGKLCRLGVNEFILHNDNIVTFEIFRLTVDFPQPYGIYIKANEDGTSTSSPNRCICTNVANVNYNTNPRSTVVQLADGPMNLTFTLDAVTSTNQYGYPGYATVASAGPPTLYNITSPNVFVSLTLTPLERATHYEKLESYSTGPFIRM